MKKRSIDTYTIQGKQLSKNAIKKELYRILNTQPSTSEIQGKDLEFVLEAFKTARYYQEKTKGQSIIKVVRNYTYRFPRDNLLTISSCSFNIKNVLNLLYT